MKPHTGVHALHGSSSQLDSTNQAGKTLTTQHTVLRGEALDAIANKYGTSVDALLQDNKHLLRSPRDLAPGMRLEVVAPLAQQTGEDQHSPPEVQTINGFIASRYLVSELSGILQDEKIAETQNKIQGLELAQEIHSLSGDQLPSDEQEELDLLRSTLNELKK